MGEAILLTQFPTRQHPLPAELLAFLRERWSIRQHIPFDELPARESLEEFDENYPWTEAAAAQVECVAQTRNAQREAPDATLIHAGIVPIPLAFHLGHLLGQTAKPVIFQHHHRNRDWRWPSDRATADLFEPLRTPARSDAPGDVLIRVSSSYTVTPSSTQFLTKFAPYAYDVAVRNPRRDALESPQDVWELGDRFRQALDRSLEDFGAKSQRHLVAAVPVSAALVMGMQVSATIDPPIQTWNHLGRRRRPRVRAIAIGEFAELPRVLLLGASPPDTRKIASVEEIREIEELLADLEDRVTVSARPKAKAYDDLVKHLHDFSPTALHLACHGRFDAVSLSARDDRSCPVDLPDLERLLARAPRLVCVVLSACDSDDLAHSLSSRIPVVIGFAGGLDDESALSFSRGFWSSISRGLSVADAFADGQIELRDRARPILHHQPQIDTKALFLVPE